MATTAKDKKPRKSPVKSSKAMRARKPAVRNQRTVRTSRPRSGNPFPWKVFWIAFVVIFFGVIIAYEWENVVAWFLDLGNGTAGLLGWGLLLLILAAIVVAAVLKRQAVAEFAEKTTLRYWYRWLGAVAVFFAIWGTLGLAGAGGSFGSSIGASTTGGFLRVIGLYILGIALIIPAISWKAIKALSGFVSQPFRSPPKIPPYTYPAGRPNQMAVDLGREPDEGPEPPRIPSSVL